MNNSKSKRHVNRQLCAVRLGRYAWRPLGAVLYQLSHEFVWIGRVKHIAGLHFPSLLQLADLLIGQSGDQQSAHSVLLSFFDGDAVRDAEIGVVEFWYRGQRGF